MGLDHAQQAQAGGGPALYEEGRTVVVLVLDDNPDDVLAVGRCLRQLPGWETEILVCMSEAEAVEDVRKRDIDLVLLDYELGVNTGLEVLPLLLEAGLAAPVILLTGHSGEDLVIEALRAGVADYIPKDVLSPSSLGRAARNALEKHDLSVALESRRVELEDTIIDLQRRQREIETFYHGLSHELKTPLTAIREFVSLVLEGTTGELNERQVDLLETALRNCDQMVVCMNDILDASRLDTGKLELSPASQDLWDVVHDVLASHLADASGRGIDLVATRGSDCTVVKIDAHRIYQVLSNLVGNALKFTPPGGCVEICVTDDPDGSDALHVSITDSGRGIASEDLPRVFERLYQSCREDAATSGGLGMGLYICRELVRLHGSDIQVASEPGRGTSFSFLLPRAVQDTPPET